MKDYLSIDELSEYINLSNSTIYKKTHLRTIPFIKTGKKLLFKKEAIDEWLQQHTHDTMSDLQNNIVGFLKPSRNQD